MKKSGLTLGVAALAAICLSAAALAVEENDGAVCGAINPDPNGGCNVTPASFQDLGVLSDGLNSVTGHVGTYATDGVNFSNRDLDWMSFSIANGRKVTFTGSTFFAGGGTDNVLFVGPAPACDAPGGQPIFYGVQAPSPQSVSFWLDAGTYIVILTSPFEANATTPIYACGTYTLDINVELDDFTNVCNAASGSCDVAHGTGGCDDFACCEAVCAVDPLCCDIAWNVNCAGGTAQLPGYAVTICGHFIYSCNATGNSPPNDCLTAPTLVSIGSEIETVAFDTTNAKTDGPSPAVTGATAMGKDVWYVVSVPSDGQLTISQCAGATYDAVIELYALGTSSVVDPATLPDNFIGSVDDTCGVVGGPATLTLIDAVAGEYYLARVGGFDADGDVSTQNDVATGSGTIDFSFESIIFYPGVQQFVVQVNPAQNVNLGLSSGPISATQPQRWKAEPFTAAALDGAAQWEVTKIIAKGFIAIPTAGLPPGGGIAATQLKWIIWNRTGTAKPVDGDQVASGVVPMPTPYDDPLDDFATSSYLIPVPEGTFLDPGDYYLTIYGDDPTSINNPGGTTACNFAWFIYSNDGIKLTDGGVHGWRSNTFPTGGFLLYTGLNGVYNVQAGDNPDSLYTNSFAIFGKSSGKVETCPTDVNDDGVTDASDLGIVLGSWGTAGAGDIDGSGNTDATDLGLVLGGWGPC
jgi:hypothetical protein